MKKLSTLFVAGLFAAGGAAIAQDDVNFDELDQDGDGQLSRTEVAQNGDLAANFSRMDMDGDGYLDENEVQDVSMQGQDEYQATGSETGVQETEDDFQETGVQDQQAEDDFQSDDFQETGVETDTDEQIDDTDRDSGTADDWR